MTQTTEQNVKRVYDGHVNGRRQYTLSRDGKTKHVVSCKYCKGREYAWIGKHYMERDRAIEAHVVKCERASRHLENLKARGLSHDSAMRTVECYFSVLPFHWIDRGDGGHVCNARCMSATGPSCECRCRGENHGGRA